MECKILKINYRLARRQYKTSFMSSLMGILGKNNHLYMMLTGMLIVCCLSSCSKDEEDDMVEIGTVENVVVDNNGVASGGHSFTRIDDKNFYIDDIKYTVVDSVLEVTGYDQTFFKGEANIVSSLDYHNIHFNVKSINSEAFHSCEIIKTVIIPNGIAKIGGYAFAGCVNLESVSIGNSLSYISGETFSGCTKLLSIRVAGDNRKYDSRNNCNAIIETASNSLIVGCKNTVIPSSVTRIAKSAFYGCSAMTSIAIPDNITSIGSYTFAYCSNLKTIILSENTTTIGSFAFYDCKNLTSITIPNKVTEIGREAFIGCSNLSVTLHSSEIRDSWFHDAPIKELQVGDETTIIEKHAFMGCERLSKVSLGKNVRTIEYGAFYECSNLRDFYCYSEAVPEATEGFSAMRTTLSGSFMTYGVDFRQATLHVPAASINDYQNIQPWKFFGKIVAL